MANHFKFPDVGEGITEGEIVKWTVSEGDRIEADQTLVEVETDKAVVELPSPYAGTVLKIHVKEKEIVKVGEFLVTIGEEGEDFTMTEPPTADQQDIQDVPGPGIVGEIKESREEIREIKATPRVRRLAREMGIDLKTVQGTGTQGRITDEDIQKMRGKEPPKPEPEQKEIEPQVKPVKIKLNSIFTVNWKGFHSRGVRRATARKMSEAVNKAAHVTHFEEADATELVKIREEFKQKANQKTIKLTYLPFIVKAVVAALKEHPLLNAMLDDEEEEIIIKKYFNLGIAVDVPDGLIVPVIKAADQKSLFELAEEIQKLAEEAKERSLDLADLRGGTFSITNVGMLGGEFATPIINYPEVAILATMRIKDRIRAEEGGIKIKKTLPLCLSFDHRVLDGAEAARFMNDLLQFLENPSRLDLDNKTE